MDKKQSFLIRVTAGPSKPGVTPKMTLMPVLQNKDGRIRPNHICICCLIQTGPLLRLATCKHVELLFCIAETLVDYKDKFICKFCHDLLKKFSLFRQQVNENVATVLGGGLIKMNKKVLNMRITHDPPLEIAQIFTPKPNPLEEQLHSEFEIKPEPMDDGAGQTDSLNTTLQPDFEMDIPLYAIKSTNEIKKELPEVNNFIHAEQQNFIQTVPKVPIKKVISMVQPQTTQPIIKLPLDNQISMVHGPMITEPAKKVVVQIPDLIYRPMAAPKPFDVRKFLDTKKKELQKKMLEEKQRAYLKARYVVQDKLEGKIRMVNLNEKEMREEREKDKKRSMYVNLAYKCHTCLLGFDLELTYKTHMENKHYKSPHTCPICKCAYETDQRMRSHSQRVHYTRFECDACGAWFRNLRQTINHYSDEHEKIEETFECTKCDFVSNEYRTMRSHKIVHLENIECDHCEKTFRYKQLLENHILYDHKNMKSKNYKCDICQKKFSKHNGLRHHMRTVHENGSEPAYCYDCDKVFKSEATLETHRKRAHSTKRPDQDKYTCDDCKKQFSCKYEVKYHIYFEHLKIIEHRCPHCKKNFKFARTLKRHIDFVHKKKVLPRSHVCDYCGKAFRVLRILQNHLRSHTGERPFKCVNCPATFRQTSSRYTHNRMVHKVRGGTTKVDQGCEQKGKSD